MRRNVFWFGLGMLLLSAFIVPGTVQAAEEPAAEDTVVTDETGVEWEYSYGTVVSVSADKIVVKEYDYDKDVEVEVTYTIEADLELQNVASIEQIKVGDDIDLYFDSKDDKKIARIISVESPEEKQTAAEETPAAEEPGDSAKSK